MQIQLKTTAVPLNKPHETHAANLFIPVGIFFVCVCEYVCISGTWE